MKSFRVIPKRTKANIAQVAQESSDSARNVVMVKTERYDFLADCTSVFLKAQQKSLVVYGDAVLLFTFTLSVVISSALGRTEVSRSSRPVLLWQLNTAVLTIQQVMWPLRLRCSLSSLLLAGAGRGAILGSRTSSALSFEGHFAHLAYHTQQSTRQNC